jgi:predicted Rossmann-fold nucleotide-binding protein
MMEQGWYHTELTTLIIEVEKMYDRKRLMAEKSDVVIALPGGCGTLEELLGIITWYVVHTLEEAFEAIYNTPVRDASVRKFAAI